MRAAHVTSVLVSILPVPAALLLQNANIALLVGLSLAIVASSNFPAILLTLFWKKFNTHGAIIGMPAGIVSSVGLTVTGPTFMGDSALSSR